MRQRTQISRNVQSLHRLSCQSIVTSPPLRWRMEIEQGVSWVESKGKVNKSYELMWWLVADVMVGWVGISAAKGNGSYFSRKECG